MAQVTVTHKFIHTAPRKLRILSDMVRGLPADRAIAELSSLPKAGGQVVEKLIKAGVAAAREHGLQVANLVVASIMVDEGPRLRRFITMSRGRSERIHKQMSHLKLTLSDEAVTVASSKAYKRELNRGKKLAEKVADKVETAPIEPTNLDMPQVAEEPVVAETNTEEGSK